MKKISYKKNLFFTMIDYVQNNYKMLGMIVSCLSVIVFALIYFGEYVESKLIFSYYGLTHSLYVFNNQRFMCNIVLAIIISLFFMVIAFFVKQVYNDFKNKKIKYSPFCFVAILIIDYFIYKIYTLELDKVNIYAFFAFALAYESLFTFLLYNKAW